jgi:hypothetical protein
MKIENEKINAMRKFLDLLFIILALTNCKEEEAIAYYPISNESKEWIYYQEGSYWIYRNEQQNLIDSLFIENSSIEKKYYYGGFGVEYYLDDLKINYREPNYYHVEKEYMITNSFLTRQFSNDTYYPYFDINNNDIGIEYELGNCTKENLEHYEIFEVQGNNFFDVYLIQLKDSLNALTINYYLAKKNGIIKIIVQDSLTTMTWDLIEYNIIQ